MAPTSNTCAQLSKRSLFFGACVLSAAVIFIVYVFYFSTISKKFLFALEANQSQDIGYLSKPEAPPSEWGQASRVTPITVTPQSRVSPITVTPQSRVTPITVTPQSRTTFPSSVNSTFPPHPNPYVHLLGPRQMSDRKTKKILLWTTAWGEDWKGAINFLGCPVFDCVVTSTRSELDQSDVVAFYSTDMKIDDLPPRRSPHQAWLYCNWESPCLTSIKFKPWENLINWTITYRRDADIYSPYGKVAKLSPDERARVNNTWENQKRSKFALWMATNCNDHAKRKNMVTELAKYVPVDTFGKCGAARLPEECGRYKDVFCPHLLRDYKFYLAFENAICRDYLTEKIWNAFFRDQVPVVLGGGVDYEHILPPNSYISVSQFPDIRALAKHLQFLASHPEEYNKYFAWKRDYKVVVDYKWCSMCKAMHDSQRPAQVYWNLGKWMYQDLDTCSCHDKEVA